MRLASARAVTDAAVRMDESILEAYMGPNRTLQEVRAELVREGGIRTLLGAFSEACRADLDGLAQ